MRVKLKEIGPDGLRVGWRLEPSFLRSCLEETGIDAHGAEGEAMLSLTRNGARVFVHGSVRASLHVACGRCLEPAQVAVDAPLQVTFVPAPVERQAREKEIRAGDPDYCTYSGDEVDLGNLVREQILLGIPFAPLCREDCLGLCPRCGGDRNSTACNCPPPDGTVGAGRLRI